MVSGPHSGVDHSRVSLCAKFGNPDTTMRPDNRATTTTQPRLLRRALDFIHDNAEYEITIRDIASASDVTPRALQYAFREHLDTTPLEYLRRIRLERAHRELQSADPALDTVTSIAGRCGFSHPGRFSSAYKQVFGTEPSRTLRSS
ncbi:HTH-type transcriptional regulator CdhR [Mycolicibacterium vanbaalenii]|uniref:HTH-type transcriptional regulator CdhR n=2 Tax=Mycolicibacterium vanbaalenii TaxID=110539 RepID=A0A5S9R9W1_MYCVN|nr:HTH-type transcriptional regulator CdhR [Mycolicibacterium vanbaalenii]